MTDIQDAFSGETNAGDKIENKRCIHGIVPVFNTWGRPLYEALLFIRKTRMPVPQDIPGSDDEYMTISVERWDFSRSAWVTDETLLTSLDSSSHNLDLYDGRTEGKDEEAFFNCLKAAKADYEKDHDNNTGPEI